MRGPFLKKCNFKTVKPAASEKVEEKLFKKNQKKIIAIKY